MPNLSVLRATWNETYNDPDDGKVLICTPYDDIAFGYDPAALQLLAKDLETGYGGQYWSAKRSQHLRSIWPQYDDHRDQQFTVVDITNLTL